MNKSVILTIILVAGSFAVTAKAVDPLQASELRQLCSEFESAHESAATRQCLLYINGFLDGAVVTDERVALNVAEELEREETFSERAFRTRVGSRMKNTGPTGYAEFCVGQPVPIRDVVTFVIAEFNEHDLDEEGLARDWVYDALRRYYPCESE